MTFMRKFFVLLSLFTNHPLLPKITPKTGSLLEDGELAQRLFFANLHMPDQSPDKASSLIRVLKLGKLQLASASLVLKEELSYPIRMAIRQRLKRS